MKNAKYSEKALLGLPLQFDDLGLDLYPGSGFIPPSSFMPPYASFIPHSIPQPGLEMSYAVETHHEHKKF